jgi:hypothetical protein
MSAKFTSWRDIKVKAAAVDPRTAAEREAGRADAVGRREAYVRGHQLAEIREAAGLTSALIRRKGAPSATPE